MVHKRIMRDVRALAALYRPTWSGISAAIAATGVPTMDGTTLVGGDPRETLKSIKERSAELRAARPELEKEVAEARDTYAKAGAPAEDSAEFKAAEKAVEARGNCLDELASLGKRESLLLESMGQSPASERPGHDRPAGDSSDPRGWDTAQLFAGEAGEAMAKQLDSMSGSKAQFGTFALGQVISRDDFRDMLAADVAPSTSQRRGDWLGVVPQLRRPLRVLDLIPTGTMDNNTLPYTREEGSFVTAKPTKEGETKPESGVTFTDAEAVARTIAHWMKVRKQALSDVSALRSIMDSRLRYGVERILEKEALAGNGSDPQLEGITKTSGISITKFAADVTGGADQILRAITTILLNDAQATGIVAHPLDWQEILLAKAAGDGHYFSGGPFSVTPQLLWGVPLVPSPAITQSVPLVGDFEIGAQLFIREGVNVLMSDSDGEDFIKNRLTMLAEMRAALAVFRPSVFSKVYMTKKAEEETL